MKRIEALDGLRGVALLLVMLYHANLLAIGWVGVQLFFVLSGFLITGQLLEFRQRLAPAAALQQFWRRRIVRIIPALALFLLLAFLAGQLFDLAKLQTAPRYWWAAAGFYYNVELALSPAAKSAALGHVWSLSIEEQFYLAWPLLILFAPRRGMQAMLLALILAGPVLRLVLFRSLETAWPPGAQATAIALLTPAHLDAFACGGALAVWPQLIRRIARPGAWLLGLGLLVYLAGAAVNGWGLAPKALLAAPLELGYPNALARGWQFLWGYSALNLIGALAIAWAAGPQAPSLLRWTPLRRCGQISYAGYLWHYPLAVLLAPLTLSIAQLTGFGLYGSLLLWFPGYLIVVLLAAAASTYGVELPLRHRLLRPRPPSP